MASLLARIRDIVTLRALSQRRNANALAAHLGVNEADATWILRRSREVGYPRALADFRDSGRAPGQPLPDLDPRA